MVENIEKKGLAETGLPQAHAFGLIGRQSVRATFRLTEATIDAIQVVASQLGIKQKSLFDHLVEDADLLETIAREANKFEWGKPQLIQKTFVISRRSLVSLDTIARDFEMPRDILVEISVRRLLPLIKREQEKHLRRKQLLKSIEANYASVKRLANRVNARLGKTDPLSKELATAIAVYSSAIERMAAYVEKGKSIEKFDLEAFTSEAIHEPRITADSPGG